MKKIMFKKISTVLILSCLCFGFLLPSSVFASKIMDGAKNTSKEAFDTATTNENTIVEVSGGVVSVVLSLLGVIFIILIVVGGIIWMTSAGNEEKTKKATSILVAAIIGLLIVVSAYAIWWFVFSKTGTL